MLLFLKCGHIPSLRKNKKINEHHWVGGYTTDGKPDNKMLLLKNNEYVYHPVRKLEIYLDKKVSFDFDIEDVNSFVVGQGALKADTLNNKKMKCH